VLDLLYPACCYVCDRVGEGYLCPPCAASVSPVPEPYCPICGEPDSPGPCYACRHHRPAFARARAVGLYGGVLREAIHVLKYQRKPLIAVALAGLLADYLEGEPEMRRIHAVAPVPIHCSRERRRGFNQSLLLAKPVAQYLEVPLLEGVLIRAVETPPQVGLDRNARRVNVAGAFAVARPAAVRSLHVLLVDDVLTTGATCSAAAQALLTAGARAVYVLTLAREP
jgi:ComF family protein